MQQTPVQQLRQALQGDEFKGFKELSAELSVSEKDLPALLDKLSHALKRDGKRLHIEAAHCVACKFEFNTRERYTRPSRCPSCRSERIAPPRFKIA